MRAWSCRYSKIGTCSDGALSRRPGWTARCSEAIRLVSGTLRARISCSTKNSTSPSAPAIAAMPARGRCRASQASCLSLSAVAATGRMDSSTRAGPRAGAGAVPARAGSRSGRRSATRGRPRTAGGPVRARRAGSGPRYGAGGRAVYGCDGPRPRDCRLARVLIREVMTESVVTAQPQQSVREVAMLMRERNVGSVVLVDGGRAVGFLTDRDLAISVLADARDPSGPAADHASSPVITAAPDMDVEEGAELMMRHGVRRLVVVDGGLLAGVVTLDDLASRIGERGVASELSARVTRAALPDYFFHERGGG